MYDQSAPTQLICEFSSARIIFYMLSGTNWHRIAIAKTYMVGPRHSVSCLHANPCLKEVICVPFCFFHCDLGVSDVNLVCDCSAEGTCRSTKP